MFVQKLSDQRFVFLRLREEGEMTRSLNRNKFGILDAPDNRLGVREIHYSVSRPVDHQGRCRDRQWVLLTHSTLLDDIVNISFQTQTRRTHVCHEVHKKSELVRILTEYFPVSLRQKPIVLVEKQTLGESHD